MPRRLLDGSDGGTTPGGAFSRLDGPRVRGGWGSMTEWTDTRRQRESPEVVERRGGAADEARLLAVMERVARLAERHAERAADPRPRDEHGRLPPLVSAREALASLNPRSRRYLKSAGRLAYRWRCRKGLTEAEALELRADALAAWWRAKHGLEFRCLVALALSPELGPEAFAELRPADFESVPYAALFAAWREHGLPAPADVAQLLEGRGYVPASPPRAATAAHLPPAWWADELRGTLAELLGRRRRRLTSLAPTLRLTTSRTSYRACTLSAPHEV